MKRLNTIILVAIFTLFLSFNLSVSLAQNTQEEEFSLDDITSDGKPEEQIPIIKVKDISIKKNYLSLIPAFLILGLVILPKKRSGHEESKS